MTLVSLSFTDFAKKYNLNDVGFIDKFYQNIDKKLPLILDKNLIERFGYNGSATMQKNQVMKLIAGLPVDLAEGVMEMSISEYNNLLSGELFSPSLPEPKSLVGKTQTIISFKTFKHLLMLSNTREGYKFRNHFMAIEDINDHYKSYINKLLSYQISKCKNKLLISEENYIDLQAEKDELKSTNAYLIKKSKIDAIEYKVELAHIARCAKYEADTAAIEIEELRNKLADATANAAKENANATKVSPTAVSPTAVSPTIIQLIILVRYKVKEESYGDVWGYVMIKTNNLQKRINNLKKKYANYKSEVCDIISSNNLILWKSTCGNHSIKAGKLKINNWFEISQD